MVFPDANEVTSLNGGFQTSKEFAMEYIKNQQKDGSSERVHSRPTTTHARDYEKQFLEGTFPLQFPYGRGGLNEERETRVTKEECLRHYLQLSLRALMKAEFILTIHSMWEKEKALTTALIKCKAPFGESNVGTAIGQMSEEELNTAWRWHNIERGRRNQSRPNNNVGFSFLDAIEASCRSMAHTNEAAKMARRRMFSLWYSFGPPSLFYTVSPCDETNFRIRVYINPNKDVSTLIVYKRVILCSLHINS